MCYLWYIGWRNQLQHQFYVTPLHNHKHSWRGILLLCIFTLFLTIIYNDGHDGFLKSCGYLNMSLAHEYVCVYICTRIFCNNAHAENINMIFEQWRKCILYLKKRNDNMLGYIQNHLPIYEAFIVCEPGYRKMWMCNCKHTYNEHWTLKVQQFW